mgnify:CR=1 FL=1
MKKIIAAVAAALILTSCTISSPITTTQKWLESLKANDFQQASTLIVTQNNQPLSEEEQTHFANEFRERYGTVTAASVDNAIPLPEERLSHLKATEGFEVFFTQVSEKRGEEHLKRFVVKHEGEWKVVESIK